MADIKLLFRGELKLTSPLIIGCGEDGNTDSDILLDSENNPFIPASSIAGVISSFIDKTDIEKEEKEKIFGENDNQSKIVFYDLLLKKDIEPTITKRDGIAINNKTGITQDSSKFDYEVIDEGAVFDFKILLNFDNEKLLKTIIDAFVSQKIRIGAKTNNGFGEVKLLDDYEVYRYDFSNKKNVLKWLKREDGEDITTKFSGDIYSYSKNYILLNLVLSIKDSLIIKSYEDNKFGADSTHLKSKGDDIISGSSFKGALRARSERIYNTLNSKLTVGQLFGFKGDGDGSGQKGRFSVNEVRLPQNMVSEMQHRIKIDSFTGGTIRGALFDSMPLFSGGEKIEKMEINIADAKESDLGLLLLIMKDLWSGDLAIGGEKNIGRGVFKGIGATIDYSFGNGNKFVSVDENLSGLKENEAFFQSCINKLKEENK